MRPLNTSRRSLLTLLHTSHSSRFAYPCFLLSFYHHVYPVYLLFRPLIARRAEFHTRALAPLARSLVRDWDTHVSPSPSSSLVLVHLCTMCTTYGFLIVGSLVAFARECASITIIARRRIGSRFVGPQRPAFCARGARGLTRFNRGRLSLEIRPVVICNPPAVQI